MRTLNLLGIFYKGARGETGRRASLRKNLITCFSLAKLTIFDPPLLKPYIFLLFKILPRIDQERKKEPQITPGFNHN
jgi:hypothetical protein